MSFGVDAFKLLDLGFKHVDFIGVAGGLLLEILVILIDLVDGAIIFKAWVIEPLVVLRNGEKTIRVVLIVEALEIVVT